MGASALIAPPPCINHGRLTEGYRKAADREPFKGARGDLRRRVRAINAKRVFTGERKREREREARHLESSIRHPLAPPSKSRNKSASRINRSMDAGLFINHFPANIYFGRGTPQMGGGEYLVSLAGNVVLIAIPSQFQD